MLHTENKLQETDRRLKLLLISALAMLAMTEGKAQGGDVPPRLVLSITIDQLRSDYLERFTPLFGENGFKRMMRDGTTYRNGYLDFNNPDLASAVATINTGTSPSIHGIIGRDWYDRRSESVVNCVGDDDFLGNYTKSGFSPEKLLVSTLADELKISTQERGLVFAIAADPESALLSAGRNADCAVWINDDNGKWCSTTYYKDLPYWVTLYNDSLSIDQRIDGMDWLPLLDCRNYTYLTSEWQDETFRHSFKDYRTLKFKKFIKSGLVNEEIGNMAVRCIEKSLAGNDAVPDIVAVTLYAGNFDGKSTIECSLEIQDTYARLDRQVGRIVDAAAKKAGGANNLLVVITSTGYVGKENADLKKYKIPSGEFYINRCSALLNMFLMAKYGEGNYVSGYAGNEIYLNHPLLKERKLDYDTITRDATEFLSTFDGIANAYTAKHILIGAWDPEIQRWRNRFNYRRSGDVLYELLPGWSSRDEDSYEYRVERANFTASPIIFWGCGVKGEAINTPVNTEIVAPTIAYYLRIRAPNAAAAIPVTDLKHGQGRLY